MIETMRTVRTYPNRSFSALLFLGMSETEKTDMSEFEGLEEGCTMY